MLFFIHTTLILFISAKVASVFDPTDDQTHCMANCAVQVAPQSRCDSQDTACKCASASFASNAKQCITTRCSISASDTQDSLTAQSQSLSSTGGSSASNTPSTGSTPTAGSGNNGKNSAGRTGCIASAIVGSVVFSAVLLA
ncbi:hypothetical protein B0H19DRAFT_1253596 [Mycena capillaripes]|nr:hypothetical protein B0H19DRAFT_1253596 [Mycena capillaripes]